MKYIRRTNKNITSNFFKELLLDRNIIQNSWNEEQINKFFKPTIENEEHCELLDHVADGCRLFREAIEGDKTIYLPVDPDVDGLTSAALFYNYCKEVIEKKLNKEIHIEYHIPEGKEHGLSTIMDWFPENGNGNLVFVIDASSNDYKEHKELSERGYTICVVDHHEAPHYSEDAVVINNQLSKNYPNKSLSGVGVIYKFFEYWERMMNWEPFSLQYIDLVALGQVSDVMIMSTMENRFICDYGLTHINNHFFRELIRKQCFSLFGISDSAWSNGYYYDGSVNQIGVAFYITPLINALIRMGSPREKELLFLAFITPEVLIDSTKRGEKGMQETISTQSVRNCVNAKSRQTKERDKAAELLDIQILENNLEDNKILILNADELGVSNNLTGLCAMNVAAKYKKPVLLGRTTPDGKELKGSIRGFDGSPLPNFKSFLQESGLMDYVEGHQGAAGFGIPIHNVERLVAYANNKLKDVNFNEGCYEVDFVVNSQTTYLKDLIEVLYSNRKFFGQGCPEALIAVENITIDSNTIQVIGKGDTFKFTINGITYIKFKSEDLINEIKEKNGKLNITVVGRPNMNFWNGVSTPQIQIEEMDIKESSIYDF